MASEDLDVESLRRGLESLPQELYDQIVNIVFTAPPGVRIIESYKCKNVPEALKLMQISHFTRTQYAATYFGHGAHFSFDPEGQSFLATYIDQGPYFGFALQGQSFLKWYKSVGQKHQALLQKVILVVEGVSHPETFVAALRRAILRELPDCDGSTVAAKLFLQANGKVYG